MESEFFILTVVGDEADWLSYFFWPSIERIAR